MPVITSAYPHKTVQQLDNVLSDAVGRLGRVVLLVDENYTVDPRDDLIILAASTSSGSDWTLTLPETLPVNHRLLVVMPTAPSGVDAYVTAGAAVTTFDTAGQTATILSLGGTALVEGSAAPAETSAGALTATTGDITADAGDIVATAGDIVATAGDIVATAGDIVVTAGTLKAPGLGVFADNAAALAGLLVAGDFYTTATGELRVVV